MVQRARSARGASFQSWARGTPLPGGRRDDLAQHFAGRGARLPARRDDGDGRRFRAFRKATDYRPTRAEVWVVVDLSSHATEEALRITNSTVKDASHWRRRPGRVRRLPQGPGSTVKGSEGALPGDARLVQRRQGLLQVGGQAPADGDGVGSALLHAINAAARRAARRTPPDADAARDGLHPNQSPPSISFRVDQRQARTQPPRRADVRRDEALPLGRRDPEE